MKRLRLQSAMEYLMTYGWAILIVAVVLTALYALGIFNRNNVTQTSCIAAPGYLCSNPVFSHTSGNLIVTVGQSTGTDWKTANIAFVNTSQLATVEAGGFPSGFPVNQVQNGLVAGSSATVSLPMTTPNVNLGASFTGTVWAQYTTSTTQIQSYYVQIASVQAKAT